jgi:predicted ATPase
VLEQREWLAESYFQALGELLAFLEQAGELHQALEHARRGVHIDPLREEARRDLMRLYAAVGQPEAALRQYRELEDRLKHELEAEPSAATRELARQIKEGPHLRPLPRPPVTAPPPAAELPTVTVTFLFTDIEASKHRQRPEPIFPLVNPELPKEFPPRRSLEAFAHNLPVQLTSFVGRRQEMAEVKRLLASTHLLTLTGAGGCGKTRLALQTAADLIGEYGDGVWLVELASLSEPGLVPQSVAATLGLREEPHRPLTETLTDALRARSLLLVLDNCEHLVSACPQLAQALLQRCPNLRILATSREGLRIAGETTYRVPLLSLPDLQRLPPVSLLTQSDAVQLFVERATAALPSFTLNDQNAAAVAQVCYRLDAIPLALELAAARVNALATEKIAERLEDRFRLLTGGNRTALPRHQTLRALIDWSYELLAEPERVLLRAADGIEAEEVLDLLTILVEKSLVQYEAPGTHAARGCGEARYRLLETVRQYARDRLRETGEEDAVRERHLIFFLRLAEFHPGAEAHALVGAAKRSSWPIATSPSSSCFRTPACVSATSASSPWETWIG